MTTMTVKVSITFELENLIKNELNNEKEFYVNISENNQFPPINDITSKMGIIKNCINKVVIIINIMDFGIKMV